MTDTETWIAKLRRSLREIRDRCRDSAAPRSVPGEGGERPFRGWLINPFLPECLGWPPAQIVQGERYDNGPIALERLVTGRRPTPKGFFQIGEEFLGEVPVSLPRRGEEARAIIASVKRLVGGLEPGEAEKEEARLFARVTAILTSS